MGADTVYEGSGQLFGSFGVTRTLGGVSRRALQLEVLGGRSFAAGDCIPGFTVCAPPFNFVGVGLNAFTSITGVTTPDAFTLGAGAGLYRVASEWHSVSPRLVGGLQASAYAPFIVGGHAALVLGLKGIVLPSVHGQRAWMALITSSVRMW